MFLLPKRDEERHWLDVRLQDWKDKLLLHKQVLQERHSAPQEDKQEAPGQVMVPAFGAPTLPRLFSKAFCEKVSFIVSFNAKFGFL
jgi:hypothetical protein